MSDVPCRVIGCETLHKRAQLMCRKHWFLVSKATRDLVWKHWKAGEIRSWDVAQKKAFQEVYQNVKRGG